MSAEFKRVNEFCFWSQKVLPLVYDDSLSYAEVLYKMTNVLNELIKNNNELPDYISELIEKYITSGDIEKVVQNVVSNFILNVKYPPNGITPAKGDGTSNDYEALQGCIDYVANNGGGVVFFPYGKYLTNSLTLKSNVTLLGCGIFEAVIVLAGGANKPLLSGMCNNTQLCNIGLDCNTEVQVNDINNTVLIGNNQVINCVNFIGGFKSLIIQGTGSNVFLSNLYFDSAVNTALVIDGECNVTANNIFFNSISAIKGVSCAYIGSDNGIYEFVSYARVPICIECHGNGNTFNGVITNANENYSDEYSSNSWDISGKEKHEKYESINYKTDEFVLDAKNGLTYSLPVEINSYFKKITFKDKNNKNYNVLVEGDKLNELATQDVKNAKKFGAKGDGITDDSEAIQNCINSGYFIFIPDGNYLVTKQITINNPCIIFGCGTVLNGRNKETDISNYNNGIFYITSDNVNIYGLKFEDKALTFSIDYRGMIFANNCKNITISKCNFITSTFPIFIRGCDNVTINNNIIPKFAYAGINIVGSKNCYIYGNNVHNPNVLVDGNQYGIVLSSYGFSDGVGESENIYCYENTVKTIKPSVWEGIDAHSGININIFNNYIENFNNGIAISSSGFGVTGSCKIHDNVIVIPSVIQESRTCGITCYCKIAEIYDNYIKAPIGMQNYTNDLIICHGNYFECNDRLYSLIKGKFYINNEVSIITCNTLIVFNETDTAIITNISGNCNTLFSEIDSKAGSRLLFKNNDVTATSIPDSAYVVVDKKSTTPTAGGNNVKRGDYTANIGNDTSIMGWFYNNGWKPVKTS